MTSERYLGRGWALPILPREAGRQLPVVSGAAAVRQSMLVILETEPGERVMRPGFGCGLRRYLMKPNTTSTRALIRRDVELALSTWEPRVELAAVHVRAGEDPSMVVISVDYLHVRDGSRGNLVYPFYLEPA